MCRSRGIPGRINQSPAPQRHYIRVAAQFGFVNGPVDHVDIFGIIFYAFPAWKE